MASVCASTPCDASTISSAPSQAASDRVTSYEKSTWPGVSIRLSDVLLAVVGGVVQADRVRLDGDAALALEVHRVEDLRLHLARLQRAGDLEKAVGERRLAVVDVRDDRKVSDVLRVHYLASSG